MISSLQAIPPRREAKKSTKKDCGEDDEDGADAEKGDKECGEERYPDGAECHPGLAGEGEDRGGDEGDHGRPDAHEDGLHCGDVFELTEEQCDKQDENDGHQYVTEYGRQRPTGTPQPLSHKGGDVRRQDARHRLREGYNIEHLRICQPPATLHHLALDERYHCIPSTDGESPYLEKSCE